MPRLKYAELLRIKTISGPSHEVEFILVEGFGWCVRGLDQPLVAGDTAAIFRRAAPGAID